MCMYSTIFLNCRKHLFKSCRTRKVRSDQSLAGSLIKAHLASFRGSLPPLNSAAAYLLSSCENRGLMKIKAVKK